MLVSERVGELFHPDVEFLLYDVTSSYFEGEARANPKARRGHSRDHRRDCKQVCIGLVVTVEGLPLGYEDFAGNTHDTKTLPCEPRLIRPFDPTTRTRVFGA